jgi:peroxiredoxin
MVRTASTMLPLGTTAPDFALPDCEGKTVTRDSARGTAGILIVFMCNHCPYVKHIASELASLANEYMARGVGVVGISSNDVESHPDDAPDKMRQEAQQQGYQFAYLYDQSQSVAKAYRAACTPDFYLFDRDMKLIYRGQLDDTRPKQGTQATGKDLRAALDAMLSEKPIPEPQKASLGCNIKWKPGNEPDYFNPSVS